MFPPVSSQLDTRRERASFSVNRARKGLWSRTPWDMPVSFAASATPQHTGAPARATIPAREEDLDGDLDRGGPA
jgi:hypothetical protein